MPAPAHVDPVDPFDLPEWLGDREVTWTALTGVRGAGEVTGELSAAGVTTPLACDVRTADVAYPQPVLEEKWRREAHQAWSLGQVLLVFYGGRLTLLPPGTELSADLVLEVLGRLAKAVGVKPGRFVAALRL